MYIYAFGSICRGEIDIYSDIDLILIHNEQSNLNNLNVDLFSIYSINRIKELWIEGNPFAWHLYKESKLIYTQNGKDIISMIGKPSKYLNYQHDCLKFYNLYLDSVKSIHKNLQAYVFDLAMIFLSIRNFATCYSLGINEETIFSRHSAKLIGKDKINISDETFKILERAKHIATRGIEDKIKIEEINKVLLEESKITNWFNGLNNKIKNGSIQQ